ncbi:MAG: type II secretion system F family protein [Endomicrobiaceae bacterium]
MPKFSYKAMNSSGKTVSGIEEAESKQSAMSKLKIQGLTVFSIESSEGGNFFSRLDAKLQAKTRKNGKVKTADIAIFCRQLSTLVNAGVNVLDAISDIALMVTNPYFGTILTNISEDVKSGKNLSDALSGYPKLFDNAFISMIMVGEKSGKLARVLEDLAGFLENSVKLRRKIKSAASYPVFVGTFFIFVFFGLVLGIIPKFQEMFASFGAELPLPTKMVMNFSNLLIDKMPLFIILIVVIIASFKIFTKMPEGKRRWHQFLFKIPIFAPIYTKMIFARFFQTLSTLVRSGVDIISSLQIASNTVANTYVRGIMGDIKEQVITGEQFSSEMDKYNLFPKMIVRMTAVGEKSGQLEEMFDKITDYYTDEVDVAVATLSSVVEPVLIIFLGFIVGIAVIALYLPIFNLANAMVNQSV